MMKGDNVNIAIVGCGNVGTCLVKLLTEKNIENIRIKKIVVKDLSKKREIEIDKSIFTDDISSVIHDKDISIIVELIGGYEPARSIVLTSMRQGKHIVTANKALLSKYWIELVQTAIDCRVNISFEASVGAGIPLISSISQGLVGDEIEEIYAIINGTSNFILTKMEKEKKDFKIALEEAQKQGYAEKDPTLDINGTDTAHKLSILSSLASGLHCNLDDIYTEGITNISYKDIIYADELNYKIKLLGIVKRSPTADGYEVRVHPTLLPKGNVLSGVDGIYNAIYIHTKLRERLLFYGQGAGRFPAASAVLTDLINLATQIQHDKLLPINIKIKGSMPIKHIDNLESAYYLRFTVIDKPGVLAAISSVLAKYKISIASVIQKERGDIVPVIILTHLAQEASIKKALYEIDNMDIVKDKTVLIRQEELR